MKSLVCVRPGLLQFREDALPVLKPGHAIVKIRKIGICGTDLHAFEGTQPFFDYPRILGHELAADLVDADGWLDLKPGDPVTIIPYLYCGTCIACRQGKTNCCALLQVLGVHMDGGMTEYLSVPLDAVLPAPGLTMDELAMVEPLAIGCHAVTRARLQGGEWVLVMGAGPIGLSILAFAGMKGAKTIALDTRQDRLHTATTVGKASHVVHAFKERVYDRLLELTSGDMPTAVFDATGNLDSLQAGFEYLAHGGRYIIVGLQKREIRFSHPSFHKREGSVLSSRNAVRADFEEVLDAIRKRKIEPSGWVTNRFAFDSLTEHFPLLREEGGLIKALVDMPEG
jgi:threonine dehydrogenase-like Zn-dependent dehydrogenase